MGYPKDDEDEDREKKGCENEMFFVEGSSSGSELEFSSDCQLHSCSPKKASEMTRDPSPPMVLAFCLSTEQVLQDHKLSPTSSPCPSTEEADTDSGPNDEPIEDWMILGREEQEEDRHIQLNLSYLSDSADHGSGNEDHNSCSVDDPWAVSEKDKSHSDTDQMPSGRYFTPDRSVTCHNCKKTGHLSKSCPSPKKRFTCMLCGIHGHFRRQCPGRHCSSCGLPCHGQQPCPRPPMWEQYCQRCGMTGHLSDGCPDTWRQYHLTTRSEVPLRPQQTYTLKLLKHHVHCYNCSKRGHYGYECTRKRMVSGTFPLVPYVCRYDTVEDIHQCCARIQKKTKELVRAGSISLSERQRSFQLIGEIDEESQPTQGIKGKTKRSQGVSSRERRTKNLLERHRERREMKRLRREAQARREGGLPGRSGTDSEDAYPMDPFRSSTAEQRGDKLLPRKKMKRDEGRAERRTHSRKSREAERWKKRGGMKRGYLYPHHELGAVDEHLMSPKNRVRHRRK
ncbi:zinc finger CCHC domain-containing protein 7-like [Lampris incognitus]|uniref:zinc finger CCHC domain-containing protein 7-like n=1 Tax=Lampris incognitus TaxID=2546036 RepID=UPI0024B4A199|nr:zinc finger CCHC domain-containing protein 7-like [Lampris incognitus]